MVPSISFTPEFLAMIAGVILSLLFSYVPKLNTWYAAKATEIKQLIMLGLMLVTTVAIFALGCGGILPINNFACDQNTAVYFTYTFILALVANQGIYKITPQTMAVRQAKYPIFNNPGQIL